MSPTTAHPAPSQLESSSPAIANIASTTISASQPTDPFLQSPTYGSMSSVNGSVSFMSAARQLGENGFPTVAGSLQAASGGMIPCVLDLESGSLRQAEKRKVNSEASRRLRHRKRNEIQLEQKITDQQDKIRKQTDRIQRQAQELQALIHERDYYHSERDFYREHFTRVVPPNQLPARPLSPRSFHSSRGIYFPPRYFPCVQDRT